MHHMLAYFANLAAAATNSELNAVADDGVFSRRGGTGGTGRFIFSEPWDLIGAYAIAANITRSRISAAHINAIGRHQIWPVDRSATVPDDPAWNDMRDWPLRLPLNEEVAVEASNNAGVAEDTFAFFAIAEPAFNRGFPSYLQRLTVRFTASPTGIAAGWSSPTAITMESDLRGGVYSVIGMSVQDAGALAYRLVFARRPFSQGRELRPGVLGQEAIGDRPSEIFDGRLGEFGRFHTFELPSVQAFTTAAGATTAEGRLNLLYLGEEEALMGI